jgi:hypothetical protein
MHTTSLLSTLMFWGSYQKQEPCHQPFTRCHFPERIFLALDTNPIFGRGVEPSFLNVVRISFPRVSPAPSGYTYSPNVGCCKLRSGSVGPISDTYPDSDSRLLDESRTWKDWCAVLPWGDSAVLTGLQDVHEADLPGEVP